MKRLIRLTGFGDQALFVDPDCVQGIEPRLYGWTRVVLSGGGEVSVAESCGFVARAVDRACNNVPQLARSETEDEKKCETAAAETE